MGLSGLSCKVQYSNIHVYISNTLKYEGRGMCASYAWDTLHQIFGMKMDHTRSMNRVGLRMCVCLYVYVYACVCV